MKMRQVKTAEELALWRRAYVYFDRAHAFARDYILTHGTDVTDYEVAMATELWINDLLYSDLDLAGGKPHHGVGAGVGIGVRVGAVTALPAPQPALLQPHRPRHGRCRWRAGRRIGGYGHENYRAYIIADAVRRLRPAHAEALGGQPAHCCDMQVELSVEGVTCSHRGLPHPQVPGGAGRRRSTSTTGPPTAPGVEGHQSPYIALGRPHHAAPQHVLLRGARASTTRSTAAASTGATPWSWASSRATG